MKAIIFLLMLLIGLSAAGYFIVFLRMLLTKPEEIRKEPGRFGVTIPLCFCIFFLQAMGFPDFVMGTLAYRKLKLVEDERLPQTLVMATIVPGAVAAIVYLHNGAAGVWTILFCVLAEMSGSLLGVHVVQRLNGEQIRRILGWLMVAALVALIVKSLISPSGDLTGLPLPKLILAMAVFWCLGVFNMMGVPMKPTGLLFLMLLGMTPMAAMTVVMTMGSIGPMTGGVSVVRSGKFQKKIAVCAATIGLAAAFIGSFFVLGLNQTVYTVILVLMMCYAAVDLLRHPQHT